MKNATVQIKQEGDSTARIHMEDELTIQTVEDAGKKLKNITAKYQAFVFELDNVNNLDLTYIQLILSFKKTAEDAGKKVDFDIRLTEELKALVEKAGFKELIPIQGV